MLRKFNALEQDKHGMNLFLEINYGFGNLLKGLMRGFFIIFFYFVTKFSLLMAVQISIKRN